MTDIELRQMSDVHWVISNTYVYPRYSVTAGLRRNGMRGRLPDCHPMRLAKALLSDHRIETMMKTKDRKAVAYFVSNTFELDRCWQSYKVASRIITGLLITACGATPSVCLNGAERTHAARGISAR